MERNELFLPEDQKDGKGELDNQMTCSTLVSCCWRKANENENNGSQMDWHPESAQYNHRYMDVDMSEIVND